MLPRDQMSMEQAPILWSVTDGTRLVPQVPDLTLWYGPDTYMGANLEELFTSLAALPDEEVKQLHPGTPLPCASEPCTSLTRTSEPCGAPPRTTVASRHA